MLTLCQISLLNSSSTTAISAFTLGFSLLAFRSCIVRYLFSKPFRRLTDSHFVILSQTSICSFIMIVIIVIPCAARKRYVPHDHILSFQVANKYNEFAIYALLFPKAFEPALCVNSESFRSSHWTKCFFNRIEIFSLCIFFCDSDYHILPSSKTRYYTRNLFDFSNLAARHLLSPA